jgi:hypothetical protein
LTEVAVQSTDGVIVGADLNGIAVSIKPSYTDITRFDAQETIRQKQHAFKVSNYGDWGLGLY